MGNTSLLEFIFVVFALGLWFLFPIGLFMAMNSIDRYGEYLNVVSLGNNPRKVASVTQEPRKKSIQTQTAWPHLLQRFRHHSSKNMARP